MIEDQHPEREYNRAGGCGAPTKRSIPWPRDADYHPSSTTSLRANERYDWRLPDCTDPATSYLASGTAAQICVSFPRGHLQSSVNSASPSNVCFEPRAYDPCQATPKQSLPNARAAVRAERFWTAPSSGGYPPTSPQYRFGVQGVSSGVTEDVSHVHGVLNHYPAVQMSQVQLFHVNPASNAQSTKFETHSPTSFSLSQPESRIYSRGNRSSVGPNVSYNEPDFHFVRSGYTMPLEGQAADGQNANASSATGGHVLNGFDDPFPTPNDWTYGRQSPTELSTYDSASSYCTPSDSSDPLDSVSVATMGYYCAFEEDPNEVSHPARRRVLNGNDVLDSVVCRNCGKSFTGEYRKGNLARHRRQKHGNVEQSYLCEEPYCGQSFKRQDARLKHYRKHHPGRALRPPLPRKFGVS